MHLNIVTVNKNKLIQGGFIDLAKYSFFFKIFSYQKQLL